MYSLFTFLLFAKRQLALEIENFKASEIQSEVSILPLTRQDRYNSLDRQYMADVKVIEALRGEIKIFKRFSNP